MDRKALLKNAPLICALVLFVSTSLLPVHAQNTTNAFPPTTNVNFTSATQFQIPSYNSTVVFSSGGSYANASFDSGSWNFNGLFVNDGTSALPNFMGVGFSVSARNCKVTITHLDALNVIPPPFPGQLDYNVSSVGTQAFNLHYGNLRLVNWTVYIDGAARAIGDGWSVSPDGWLNVTGATSNASIRWAEVSTLAFTASANFPIPSCNGSINFISGGTYLGEPNLANNTWSFQSLALTGSVPSGVPLWTFAISALNSNVTIDSYNPATFMGSVNGSAWLNYTVFGIGVQTINFGSDNANGNLGPYVYIDGENRSQGNGWLLLNFGSIAITGASSNVSIYYPPNPTLYNLPVPVAFADTVGVSLEAVFFSSLTGAIIIGVVSILLIKHRHSNRSIISQTNEKPIDLC